MKRFLFCIAMLFCMCMTMNAQGLKTYSGDFSIRLGGFPFSGKATYTYKNADDGTRIYEGTEKVPFFYDQNGKCLRFVTSLSANRLK